MSPRPSGRTGRCTTADAQTRLRQANGFCFAAELVIADDAEIANPGVAAALAVLGGIAAADAACCAALKQRARGADHREAVTLVETVRPHGLEMAAALGRLIAAKDESHYGLTLVSKTKAQQLLRAAKKLSSLAAEVLVRAS